LNVVAQAKKRKTMNKHNSSMLLLSLEIKWCWPEP
jgi:hypothetical protein